MKNSKLVMTALLCLASASLAGCIEYSDGERHGSITKFSRKGLICKTWEGEMVLGGLKKKSVPSGTDKDGNTTYSSSLVANVFEFTVEDPKLIKPIQDALASGEPLVLSYRQEFVTWPCRNSSDGNYFITAVR